MTEQAAPGETDLAAMLATLDVVRRPGAFSFATMPGRPTDELLRAAAAVVAEDEGTTLVLDVETAAATDLVATGEMAWLTLTVHSSLDAVGLTAAFSRALGDVGIPCNVLAGHHHDHLLVPAERADDAIAAIHSLRTTA